MHHNLALLTNITVALLAAFAGGYLARRVGLPSLVGYLLAGMAIGPFTPGFVGDIEDISQLAEMGVIFMMFGVGLHFSLRELWMVRRIAVPGAILQMLLATLFGLLLTQLWGWSIPAGLVLGLAISIASTVVLLRSLMDHGLLNTAHGQVAVGWLVLEDLATVAILVLLPALFGSTGNPWQMGGWALLKTALFVGLMLVVGTKLMPWLLTHIAHTRSRELFILAVVAVALGTAWGAAEWFGVSLALGAFLAGVVIGESDMSHQAGVEILPLRDIFAVLFFVSVGMLVNPSALLANAGQVAALTGLIVIGKGVCTLLLGVILPASGRTILVVAVGLSQIGEFSFLVGQAGLALGVLTQEQYGLILAGALLAIVVNPLLFKALLPAERLLQRLPWLWRWLERGAIPLQPLAHAMSEHVVVVGCGRVGEHIVQVLERLSVPCLIVEQDRVRAVAFQQRGASVLFGDAANSEILTHAYLAQARALVVTVPEEATAEIIVTAALDLAPNLPIIARAATGDGVQRLVTRGTRAVIHPELEGGLEIIRYTLLALDYPLLQVQAYIDAVRKDAYDIQDVSPQESQMLAQLVATVRGMEIAWQAVGKDSPVVGQTLVEANLRGETGASVIALVRNHQVIANPEPTLAFAVGDLVGLIGNATQVAAAARRLFALLITVPILLTACASQTQLGRVAPLQPVAGNELQIVTGQTLYVPAYGEVFSGNGSRSTALAVTLAIHNTDLNAPIIIQSVQYYDTNGQLVRDYVTEPVKLGPLATTGFIVEADEMRGGWGANFIVTWGAEEAVYEPVVEAIMVNTSSALGMSLISPGRVISQTLPPQP